MSHYPEPDANTSDNEPLPTIDLIHEELEAIQALEFADRLPYLRTTFDDAFAGRGLVMQRAWADHQIDFCTADPSSPHRHFLLPGIPGASDDVDTIRESYDDRADFLKGKSHDFIRVGQGEMWVVPKERAAIMQTSMSECSTLVADLIDGVLVAHISYSEREPFTTIMTELDHLGVPNEHRYVVASMNAHGVDPPISRVQTTDEYEELGIPPQNIIAFEYAFDSDSDTQFKGLTQALITADGLYAWSFDLSSDPRDRARSLPDAAFRDEVAIQFRDKSA